MFLGGLVQGCGGFGMALIAAPALMFVLEPAEVVPTVILLSLPNTLLVAYDGRKHIQPPLLAPLVIGGMVGMPFGVWALRVINADLMKVLIGSFVVLFAMTLLAGWRRPLTNMRRALFPVGVCSGFLGGSTSMGGPPVILFLANQETPKNVFRSNIVAHFCFINVVGLSMLWLNGLVTWPLVGQAAIFLPAMLVGTYCGARLSRIMPEQQFRIAVMLAAALMGATLVINNIGALPDLVRGTAG